MRKHDQSRRKFLLAAAVGAVAGQPFTRSPLMGLQAPTSEGGR